MYLVFHVTSQDQLIEGHANLWVEAPRGMFFFFQDCYVAAPRLTLDHFQESSLTNPMLITVFETYLIRKSMRTS